MSLEAIVSLSRKATNVAEARVSCQIMRDAVTSALAIYTKAHGDSAQAYLTPLSKGMISGLDDAKADLAKDSAAAWDAYVTIVEQFRNLVPAALANFDKVPPFELIAANLAAAHAAQFAEIQKTGKASIDQGAKSGGVLFVSTGTVKDVPQQQKNTLVIAGAAVVAAALIFLALS